MILTFLSKYSDLGLLVLRLGMGAMFIYHGAPKMIGGPEQWAGLGGAMANFGVTFYPAFWGFMAALAEFGGGVCLVLGLATRPAALLMAINMAVAATFHLKRGDGLAGASHAIEDGIVFLSLILLGPGGYSVDRK